MSTPFEIDKNATSPYKSHKYPTGYQNQRKKNLQTCRNLHFHSIAHMQLVKTDQLKPVRHKSHEPKKQELQLHTI